MQVLFFIFAMVLPCTLGYFVVKPFLKPRPGYKAFSVGIGYLLGWFVATLLLRLYSYLGRPFNLGEIVVIEFILIFPLLFVKEKKYCNINFHSKKTSLSVTHILSMVIVILLVYRWGITTVDLLSKPIFPWDGWLSWSAKAKIFYYSQSIPNLVGDYAPFWDVKSGSAFANGHYHPYFTSLIQTYAALAWGVWDDNIVIIPWVGLNIAMALAVFGGVRFLGAGVLPALLACYAICSLPVLDAHASLGAYADLWVCFGLVCLVLVLCGMLGYSEWSLLPILFSLVLVTYLTKNSSFPFIASLFFVFIWWVVGKNVSIFLLGLCGGIVFLGAVNENVNAMLFMVVEKFFLVGHNQFLTYNPVLEKVLNEWFSQDNWHLVFVLSFFTLFLLLCVKKTNDIAKKGWVLLNVSGIIMFLMMLLVTFLSSKMYSSDFVGYFNRVSLYIMPVFTLIATSSFMLLKQQKVNTPTF